MGTVTLLKILLEIVGAIAKYAHDKQLIEAGEAKAMLKGLEDANEAIKRANHARANVDSLPVESDPNNRDNATK